MLSGISPDAIYSIAPVQGEWPLPNTPYSPFYRGEWSIDSFPQPLINTWDSADQLIPEFDSLLREHDHVWYLNTPETTSDFSKIDAAFAQRDYRGERFEITQPRYANARFQLWCYERTGTEQCLNDASS
jgi:hypothetical protein